MISEVMSCFNSLISCNVHEKDNDLLLPISYLDWFRFVWNHNHLLKLVKHSFPDFCLSKCLSEKSQGSDVNFKFLSVTWGGGRPESYRRMSPDELDNCTCCEDK